LKNKGVKTEGYEVGVKNFDRVALRIRVSGWDSTYKLLRLLTDERLQKVTAVLVKRIDIIRVKIRNSAYSQNEGRAELFKHTG